MAKKKPKPEAEPSWADKIERACREAISRIPGINDIPEREYCQAVADAADLLQTGAEMRLEELDADDAADDED